MPHVLETTQTRDHTSVGSHKAGITRTGYHTNLGSIQCTLCDVRCRWCGLSAPLTLASGRVALRWLSPNVTASSPESP
eukprot:361801-Chlamydomonas_euryale.AAC.3